MWASTTIGQIGVRLDPYLGKLGPSFGQVLNEVECAWAVQWVIRATHWGDLNDQP